VTAVGRPRAVILGAGFAGLWAARTLARSPVDVMVVDRNNYHTFLALLYQVAAAELQAEDIAYPVRSALWGLSNVDFAMGEVIRVDLAGRIVETTGPTLPYDYLIVATGSVTHTFGVPGVEENAFFLKGLEQAVALRNHIVCCFERAAHEPDPQRRRGLLTFAIVGGGATGVEFAGALSELIHGPLRKDYPAIDFGLVRIVLLEAGAQLVANMPLPARHYAGERLRRMGVDVRTGAVVDRVLPAVVHLRDGKAIPCETAVWTAGVRGEPLAQHSGLPVGPDGRVPVLPTLQVPGHEEIYVAGDLAFIREGAGPPLPLVAQVAIQSAVAAAENVKRCVGGRNPVPFRYDDKGSMITIGRNAAAVAVGGRVYKGFFAWLLWLVIHLYHLIGFRNRMVVLVNWAWDYLLYERAVRFVFPSETSFMAKSARCASAKNDRPSSR
jgi:NADH dehydrogenase